MEELRAVSEKELMELERIRNAAEKDLRNAPQGKLRI